MSQPIPTNLGPHGEKPADAVVVVEPGFEVIAQEFWDRNRNFIFMVIAAALLVIAGREGGSYFAASREADLQADYAKVADSPDRLATFADAHNGHALAGVAYLRVADSKFSAGEFKSAATYYTKAAGSLQNEALLGRAKLGAAFSQFSSGDQAGGEAALKALSADPAVFKSTRAEAAYHLASLAAAAGKADEVRKLAEQVSLIEANGPWAQRATILVASLPATGAPATVPATAKPSVGISFKPTGK
ncbi:MAG: tetratricopeptide repeat protein [bacterium]|nr:tetratricopeptide repeat protein [bacterium]